MNTWEINATLLVQIAHELQYFMGKWYHPSYRQNEMIQSVIRDELKEYEGVFKEVVVTLEYDGKASGHNAYIGELSDDLDRIVHVLLEKNLSLPTPDLVKHILELYTKTIALHEMLYLVNPEPQSDDNKRGGEAEVHYEVDVDMTDDSEEAPVIRRPVRKGS